MKLKVKTKYTIASIMMFLAAVTVRAQDSTPETPGQETEQNEQSGQSGQQSQAQPKFSINIGGSVYGGGNAGDLSGSTKVTVYGGLLNNVYGGARMANVGGRTFVNIDGKNASDDIIIVNVYGGNDISGAIGQETGPTEDPPKLDKVPTELDNIWKTTTDDADKSKNKINNTWKAFVRTSASEKTTLTIGGQEVTGDSKMLVIGSLFGGGNGDYTYGTKTTGEGESATTTYIAKVGETEVAESATELKAPELSKTYLELKGGCIAHVFGGGNNATVSEATTICIDNESSDLVSMGTLYGARNQMDPTILLGMLKAKMALTTFQSNLTSYAFNHARIFGGNNKKAMSIMPKWNLQKGIIRDIYSGGNEGDMIHEYGLLLEIDPSDTNKDLLFINNVYGGCRRADVRPMKMIEGVMTDITAYSPEGYKFPVGLSARTLVRGGQITNVYGGNDISGKVYGGNAVGIYSSILGDVYGGGNGSYAYTDNGDLAKLDEYKDFYYDPGSSSIDALNAFRPNAEQVSIRLYGGKDPTKPIVIHGSVFVGGNSATLKKQEGMEKPMVELKIGSNVIANNVFLGNNGENMIKYEKDNDVLKLYKKYVNSDGQLSDTGTAKEKYSTLNLTDITTFTNYMNGCALDLMPSVVFDNTKRGDPDDYEAYSTNIGSFYCGGNVGSMTSAGATTIDFSHKVVIFDKLVGGCNSAIVKATDYNARYEGGLINDADADTGNKLMLNLSGLKIQPKRWNDVYEAVADGTTLTKGEKYYTSVLGDGEFTSDGTESATGSNYYVFKSAGTELIWNTIDSRNYNVKNKTYLKMDPVTSFPEGTTSSDSNADDLARRLFGGNIYGGCCESGIVNGNVVINLNETIIERDKLFDVVKSNELGEENSLYGESQTSTTNYHITKRNTGVILGQQGMDVFGQALNVFGGGKGKDTEIWGSTTINLNKGYTFQIFGGSEEGTIGKPTGTSESADLVYQTTGGTLTYSFNGKTFEYNPAYSCYVNLCGTIPGVSKKISDEENNSEDNSENKKYDNLADCEFMYGGGFFGPICGNTIVNLGDGRIFNSFAGSCNADILGHTETYIGRQIKNANKNRMGMLGNTEVSTVDPKTYILDQDTCYQAGFTWIRDITYGANDLGGRIFGSKDFTSRVRKASDDYGLNVLSMVHKYDATTNPNPDVLNAGAYTEYLQGRADAIFGGCYGTYDYSDPKFMRYTYTKGETPPTGFDLGDSKLDSNNNTLFYKPRVHNAFVNFRPTYSNTSNVVKRVFGAGQGESGEKERDWMQDRSYVLIDIPQVSEGAGASGTSGANGTNETNETNETSGNNNFNKYGEMEVFGAGAWGGVGMREPLLPMEAPTPPAEDATEDDVTNYNNDLAEYNTYLNNLDKHSAIIDLVRGEIGAAYGASYEEGVTRRTLVNVPQGSTITLGSIFGGGYGTDIYLPCDAYETHVEYHSKDAWLDYNPPRTDESGKKEGYAKKLGAIYGGNNNARRTIYSKVNIDVPVQQKHWKYGTSKGYVYGAGHGGNTWSEYTEVNLLPKPESVAGDYTGAEVFEAYGGGEAGKVFNTESVHHYMTVKDDNDDTKYKYMPDVWPEGSAKAGQTFTLNDWKAAWTLGGGLDPTNVFGTESGTSEAYWENPETNLANPLVRVAAFDDRTYPDNIPPAELAMVKGRYSANVIIHKGAYVGNYAYGGGYGQEAVVSGTTYVALLGGEVKKDIYAAGTSGDVEDAYGVGAYDPVDNPSGFVASTNVYIKGGTCRNVYGGGWRGDVGYHAGAISNVANNVSDRDAEAHIVIGDPDATDYFNGIPSITRNVYGGGEGGAIFGDAYVTINKGYIGYRYNSELSDDASTELDDRYVPELDDEKPGDNELDKGGNIFGGGYVANSYVDRTHINMWDGIVRGSLYGGGEIGPVGRGTVHKDTLKLTKISPYIKHDYTFDGCQRAAIYKGGETHVYLWGGHVMRDVFGGGRGYDNWNGEGYFQSQEEKDHMDRSSKGYVFGTTDVHIRGGEIGTDAGVLLGYGNVFGGGNEGFVYSPDGVKTGEQESDDQLVNGVPKTGGGFYYKNPVVASNGNLTSSDGLSLDCNITIEPYCKVIAAGGISGFTANATTGVKDSYAKGEYVPVEALNQLQNRNKDDAGPKKWAKLDTSGITIHNALFAGGNITEGSDNLYANTTTVYGNTAASLRDAYNYDLISLGTEEMGGLYGDGNLTLVDGFRELHIDNYGTDYYSLKDALELPEYNKLSKRQKAYYKLKYVTGEDHTFNYWECQELHTFKYKIGEEEISETYKRGQKISEEDHDRLLQYLTTDAEKALWQKGHKSFQANDQIEEGEYILMYGDEQASWTLYGVTNIYDGRPLNTIQRADMCGVFGSRMVLKGAEDRVVDAVDYHLYTINRVDEVSLNKRTSQAGDTDAKDAVHGNYFGIFSEVNYLGNLTSDVFFDDPRYTDSSDKNNKKDVTYDDLTTSYVINEDGSINTTNPTSYYQWKASMPQAKNRNNGISHNMVALASGVYLELKRQEGEQTGTDDWGYITGIIELDLINVMPGMGGGYVYARNEHGTKNYHSDWGKVTLLDYNNTARTYRHFAYTETPVSSLQQIETSGNFVHNTKQIVDDCYPHGGIYKDGYTKSPAHYWFIRGTIYVYDQYISAFTGSANAYAEKVEMPLTISAASNGRMTLREVQPNYYAYYDKNGNKLGDQTANADETIIINNTTYKLNDPVSYWNYRLMSEAEKARFVKETYVVIDSCKIGSNYYPAGYVMLPSEYEQLQTAAQSNMRVVDSGDNAVAVPAVQRATVDENGNTVDIKDDNDNPVYAAFDYVFRPSNNLGHNTGYVLTYDVNNPMVWNNYYTQTAAPGQANAKNTDDYKLLSDIDKKAYIEGPTFTPKAGQTSVYGQEMKKVGDIISKTAKDEYEKTDGVNDKIVLYPVVAAGTKLTAGQTYCTSDTGDGKFTANGTETAGTYQYYIYNKQAKVTEPAYKVTTEYSVKNADGTEKQHLNPGTPIYQSNYTSDQWTALTTGGVNAVAKPAKVCTTLLDFSASDYIYAGKLMTEAEVAALKTKVIAKNKYVDDANGTADAKATAFLATCFDDAYYCTEEGLYGGNYFEAGKAYSALESWCSMTADERENFVFNYDAFDVLVDPTYSGRDEGYYGYKPQYDGYMPESTQAAVEAGTALAQHPGSTPLSPTIYSKTQPIDYMAECTETGGVTYYKPDGTTKEIPQSTTESMWLSRTQYEAIPNEKHYYSPINVTAPGDYYVVNKTCMEGDVPYTVGQVIDEATYTSMAKKENVTVYTFTEDQTNHQKKDENGQLVFDKDGKPVYDPITYFYCRENFEIGKKGGYPATQFASGSEPLTLTTTSVKVNGSATATTSSTYKIGNEAKRGDIINQENYNKLCNDQHGFIIHGVSPTETSTLYVSSESDIHDLSSEKIITVIYLYEYEESDESGNNVVPVSERHIVNIHINFKSGVPEIGKITKPDIVLPGTTIGMNIPSVSQGAYRVTESGWELFQNENDARTHTNGTPYVNNTTPVYWYQNNYWIAYYAQTYLGKTYSNSVPISVANFHDLKKVMDDKTHHYYIDHKDVDYEPKIYINDYTSTGGNGLDLFKNLIDLTYVVNKDEDGNSVAITTDGPLKDHMPLDLSNTSMYGGGYFEFFLNADQSASEQFTTIANQPAVYYTQAECDAYNSAHGLNPGDAGFKTTSDIKIPAQCFSGTLHGDGHTISGLKHTLFDHLCGDVYNLGVTGSFTGAGIAATGNGYVENCWTNTTGTPNGSVYAVFGNPTATGDKIKQIVNCYYQTGKNYITTSSDHGLAIPKPDKAFYNGEVAYDLNGFYLWKRYCDNNSIAPADARKYQYYTVGSDNQLTLQPAKYYDNDASLCSSGYTPASAESTYVSPKYVEDRFKNGDFIYKGDGFGDIPKTPNERLYVDPDTKEESYHAIWPDDYIFFGQALNYGHMDGKNGRDQRTHQDLPSVIKKSNDRVVTTKEGNRVYRAPAYFRSKKMGLAYFNPYAVFAAKEKLTDEQIEANATAREAYPNMTAIDFTGLDDAYEANEATKAYGKGQITSAPYADITGGAFFPPLLDDGGVKEFFNADLTQNLLAYTMTTTPAATQTNDAVSAYMTDVAYGETNSKYHTVDPWNGSIGGHWVQKQGTVYVASRDHRLMDKQDFNAPITYSFASGKRMWYQRMPDNYVDIEWIDDDNNDETPLVRTTKGWEGVSLPFKAEIVTTDVKGEITHFYSGSWVSNNTDSKIGHEYWLREFVAGGSENTGKTVYEANMSYPAANSSDGNKDYTNTFLWDFYYSYNDYQDLNKDEYQENDDSHYYYKDARTHVNYPRLAAGTPYIIGFPSKRYFEFDLSGNFEATTAKEAHKIDGKIIGAQTITFASKPGDTTIRVSDDENVGVEHDNYSFKPNYLNEELPNGHFAMNNNGDAYNVLNDTPVTWNTSGSTYADATAFAAAQVAAEDGKLYSDADGTTVAATWADASTTYYTRTTPKTTVNDQNNVKAAVSAFRPYFTLASGGSARQLTRSIVFNSNKSELKGVEERDNPKEVGGTLNIFSRKHLIVVESALTYAVDVIITNTAGIIINKFTINPGETIETRVNNAGVYIVQPSELRFTKKLSVR